MRDQIVRKSLIRSHLGKNQRRGNGLGVGLTILCFDVLLGSQVIHPKMGSRPSVCDIATAVHSSPAVCKSSFT